MLYTPEAKSNKFNTHQTLYGPKSLETNLHGSYYGASLLAIDLNNDGRDDLLVGAPLYIDGDYDEGRVFVYISSGSPASWVKIIAKITAKCITFLFKKASNSEGVTILKGGNLAGGRFGTAIADAGDMNMDGYKDVIVGAPLSDSGKGAVYVYHGTSEGIYPKVKQVNITFT